MRRLVPTLPRGNENKELFRKACMIPSPLVGEGQGGGRASLGDCT
jgi:hypothetical protein